MSKHQGENARNHPRWFPVDVIIKVNIEEPPSRFRLEGLHDRVVSEVVKEESPSMTTTEYLHYKDLIRSDV